MVGLYASETAVHTMSLSPLGRDLPFNLCHFFLLCSLFIFLLMFLFLEFAPSDPLFSTNGLPLTNQLIVRLHAFRAFTSHSDEQALFSFLSHSHVNLVLVYQKSNILTLALDGLLSSCTTPHHSRFIMSSLIIYYSKRIVIFL